MKTVRQNNEGILVAESHSMPPPDEATLCGEKKWTKTPRTNSVEQSSLAGETQSVSTKDDTIDGCSTIDAIESDEESTDADWLFKLFDPVSSVNDWELDWATDSESESDLS